MPASIEDLDFYKDVIIDLYVTQRRTLAEVNKCMREKHRLYATDRQYAGRFKKWGVRVFLKSQTKDVLCAQVRRAYVQNEDIPPCNVEELRNLRRHWKTKLGDGPPLNEEERETIRALEYFMARHQIGNSASPGASMRQSSDISPKSRTMHTTEVLSGAACLSAPLPNRTSRNSVFSDVTTYANPAVPRLGMTINTHRGSSDVIESSVLFRKCLQATDKYYTACLEQHINDTHQKQQIQLPSTLTEAFDTVDNTFWHDLESALYFLKKGDTGKAKPILQSLDKRGSEVSRARSIILLRNVFSSLAPKNTSMWHSSDHRFNLHKVLLQVFAGISYSQGAERNPVWPIFDYLHKLPGEPAEIQTLFRCLLHFITNKALRTLKKNDVELFELRWAVVRFDRRNGNLTEAETDCEHLIKDAEEYFGPNNALTRKAISELAYVHNDRGKLHQKDNQTEVNAAALESYRHALALGEEVIRRARADLQQNYPDTQCVYALEDLAEFLQNTRSSRNIRSSAQCLLRAHSYAEVLWGPAMPNTQHINDKLDEVLHYINGPFNS